MMFSISNLRRRPLRIFKQLLHIKSIHSSRLPIILGIETSCDDTGCAIVDGDGSVLGESLRSQQLVHLNNGGIIPPIAQDLHRQNIEVVVEEALNSSSLTFNDINAIAVTVKPGLPLSLTIGTKYAKYLCKKYEKPLIPIHHMEAHALTARMGNKNVEFPFLVLLISGGHCLLAVAQKVDKFLLLGQSIDDAPGEAFDKIARRMKLKNLPDYAELSGGAAIEKAAKEASDPNQFAFATPMVKYKDCNFSFAGIKTVASFYVTRAETECKVPADGVIPSIHNLCAGFQLTVARHLCHRVQRGMEYVKRKSLIPPDKQTLVVSGGAACNNFIAAALQMVCDELEYKMVRPPPQLCTDNGIMIAWNGVERWKENIEILADFEDVTILKNAPLGESIIEDVMQENISCNWVKLKKLACPQSK